jgi:hypothetical protein
VSVPVTFDLNTRELSRLPDLPSFSAIAALGVVPFQFRVGTGKNTDIGVRWLGLGAGIDVRHRFFQYKRLHVATIPSFNLAFSPPSGSAFVFIGDLGLPLVVEGDLGNNLAIIGDVRLTLRNELVVSGHDVVPRLAALPGVGTRLEWTPKTFRLGLAVAWVPQSGRGGQHGVSASLDFGGRVPTKKTRRSKQ